MSDRNLNPHAEARAAMAIWSHEYAYDQKGGSMDFWDNRTPAQKAQCVEFVDKIRGLPRADGTPAPSPISVGRDDWFSQVTSFLVARGMLDARDEYDISDIMAALADNYEPAPAERKMLWQQDADNAEAGAKAVREILSPAPAELSVGVEDRCATYEDILRIVCGHLELPQSESGPADDVRLYDRALEAMDVYSKKADAYLAENTRLRFKAEAQVFQLRKALAEIGDGFVAAKDATAAHDEAVKIARSALTATADTQNPLSSTNGEIGETSPAPAELSVADDSKPASNYNPAQQIIGNYQAPAEQGGQRMTKHVKKKRKT